MGIIAGDKILLDGADLYLKYGEKVCLMGKNGTGKSTFVKAVLGNEDSICQGEIKLGSNVSIGYIPQERFEDANATVLETSENFIKRQSI